MPGTLEGGRKAAITNKLRHGADWYASIGRKGGKNGTTGGFASNVKGKDGLTGLERAKIAGAKGGKLSRRGPAKRLTEDEIETIKAEIKEADDATNG